MFNKDVKVTIFTRFENEDNFKIMRLASSYINSGTTLEENVMTDNKVEITFYTYRGCVKKLKEHINLLRFVGIEARMEIK